MEEEEEGKKQMSEEEEEESERTETAKWRSKKSHKPGETARGEKVHPRKN